MADSERRTRGVALACASFSGGAVTDMFKRKLLGMGLTPIEVTAGWNVVDSVILSLGSLLLDDPLPPVLSLGNAFWRPLLASSVVCVTGSIFHANAIKKGGLATVPFLSFNPAFSLAISSVVNGEMPSSQGVGGVIVLSVGALILSYANMTQSDDNSGGRAAIQHVSDEGEAAALLPHAEGACRLLRAKGGKPSAMQPSGRETRDASIMMGLAGFCWASSSSLEKLGLASDRSVHAQHFLCVQKFVMALPLLGYLLFQRLSAPGPKRPKPSACFRPACFSVLLLSAGLDTFSVLTYFFSLQYIFVSFSLALKRAGGTVLSVLGGMVIFGEVVSGLAWWAIMVMVAGVIAIVTS